jgi:hypothetical protein
MTQPLREGAGDPARASWTAQLKEGGRVATAAVLAAMFLALVGAFGTGGHSLGFRLGYWLGIILIGTGMAYGVSALVCRIIDPKGRPWLFGAVVTVVLAAFITALLSLFWSIFLSSATRWSALPELYAQVVVITAAMTAYITAVQKWPRSASQPADGAPAPTRFMERLPHRLRAATLLAVAAEDHYLRVHTDQGEAMILMRLSDAVAELASIDGARTHRSWWVARTALAKVERSDRRVALVLTNGVRAPVSRSHASGLRRLGWF